MRCLFLALCMSSLLCGCGDDTEAEAGGGKSDAGGDSGGDSRQPDAADGDAEGDARQPDAADVDAEGDARQPDSEPAQAGSDASVSDSSGADRTDAGGGDANEPTYVPPPKTYVDNGDGTVSDEATGLVWMRCVAGRQGSDCEDMGDAIAHPIQEAIDYCDALSLADYDDWRLPNIYELQSIVDYGARDPAIDETAFPNTPPEWTRSSTLYVIDPDYEGWGVSFGLGQVDHVDNNNWLYLRCVRGEALEPGSFEPSIVAGERIVLETASNLMWQGCASGQSGETCAGGTADWYEWQEAMDHCDRSTWAGYDDWRLPSVHELMSIADYSTFEPAIDAEAFPATPGSASEYEYPIAYFWSSTTYVSDDRRAWPVFFFNGRVWDIDGEARCSVRCVRNAP